MTQVLEAPTDEVALAEEAVTDAEAAEEELTERVRAGDDNVTADELDQARKLAVFTRLRLDAARRRAREAERDATEARKSQARASVAALAAEGQATHPATFGAVFQAAEDALTALITASQDRNSLISQGRGRALAAGLDANAGGIGPVSSDGLLVDGRPLSPVDPSRVLAGLLMQVLGNQVHRGAKPWSDLVRHAHGVNWRALAGREVNA